MPDFVKFKPGTIAAWLLVGILSAAAFLSLAPRKGEANGGGPAEDTIPAQLRIHWEETSNGSYQSDYPKGGESGNTTTHRTLDMTAVLEVPNIDYHARNFQGREVSHVFAYRESGSTSGNFKLISFSGQASYSYESHSVSSDSSGAYKQDSNHQGSGRMGPGNGSFGISIFGDSILVDAYSGQFPVTGEDSSSGGKSGELLHPFRQEKYSVSTPRFPWRDTAPDPNWTVHTRWTGSGWAGTAEWHTHSTSGVLYSKRESEDLSTVTFTFDVSGKELVEAVIVPPKSYQKWTPEGGKDEDTPGNTIVVKVELQKKGQPGKKPRQRTAKFKFELADVFKEPGVCLNWPPKDQVKVPPDFDLKIDPRLEKNPILVKKGTIAKDGQSAETPKGMQEAYVAISSYDWGAYGKLKVTATLDDGWPEPAHLQDKPGVEALTIPRDDNDNHIADAWEESLGMLGGNRSADADEDSIPDGDSTPGDGLSLYEEYRGFMAQGSHFRTDPDIKDLFIVDKNHLGFGYFRASSIQPHLVEVEEADCDPDDCENPVINFNHGYGHIGTQHALSLKNEKGDGWVGLASSTGPPKMISWIKIDVAACLKEGGQDKLDHTIAHELAHGSNVWHHGDLDYKATDVQKRTAGGRWRPESGWCRGKAPCVAAPHGQESGVQECIMRYHSSPSFYEAPGGHYRWKKPGSPGFVEGEEYAPPEPPGRIFCEKQDGTGVNAPDHQPAPKAGDATWDRGKCYERFCVNDTKPCNYRSSY